MLKATIGRVFLRLAGWQVDDNYPHEVKRLVIIAAPHTTNWDFPFTLAMAWKLHIPMKFFGKHTLFRFPFGGLLKAVGGIPVNRGKRANLIEALVAEFGEREELALVVPAEGTRAKGDYWKSGFYRIALQAGVPILPAYVDYVKKRGGFGELIHPTGDVRQDMDKIRAFYSAIIEDPPPNFTPPRLIEEEREV